MKYFFSLFGLAILLFSCKKDDIKMADNLPALYVTTHTENWMQDILAKYSNNDSITLKDLCVPRAHDAGMYVLNDCFGGNDCNTQTQDLTMEVMLKSGIRFFDVRPYKDEDGKFWTYHKTGCGGLGCNGATLEAFLLELDTYLNSHKELIILELGHFCETNPQDADFLNLLQNTLGDKIYTTSNSATNFIEKPLQEIIPSTGATGKVVLQMEQLNSGTENQSLGYFSTSFIPIEGSYANTPDYNTMVQNQLGKFNNYNANNTTIFKWSYTLTLDDGLAVACAVNENPSTSIESLSLDARNQLATTIDSWISSGYITTDKIPNILSIDYCNTTVTEQCIRLSEYHLDN